MCSTVTYPKKRFVCSAIGPVGRLCCYDVLRFFLFFLSFYYFTVSSSAVFFSMVNQELVSFKFDLQ